jgi:hypothetical protein
MQTLEMPFAPSHVLPSAQATQAAFLALCRNLVVNACAVGSDAKSLHQCDAARDVDDMEGACMHACKPTTLLVPGRHNFRISLLPPPSGAARSDALGAVDVAKAADVVLLCVPVACTSKEAGKGLGAEGSVDAETRLSLQVC